MSSLSDIYFVETCTYLKELRNTNGVKLNNFIMHKKKTEVHWSWHFSWGVVHYTDTGSVTAWPVSLRACHSSSIALSLFRCHCCYHRQFGSFLLLFTVTAVHGKTKKCVFSQMGNDTFFAPFKLLSQQIFTGLKTKQKKAPNICCIQIKKKKKKSEVKFGISSFQTGNSAFKPVVACCSGHV